MRWDDLAVFAAVAETGSFTRAAERLEVPKSSVSRQVAALEARLGTRLLHRTTRRVGTTPEGRRLLDRVAPHVAALTRAAVGDLDDEPSGTLRITAAPDFGSALLADVVARYTIRYRRVRVEARLTLQMVDLVGEGFDLALRVTSGPLPDSPHLAAARVGTMRLGMFAAPRYLATAGMPRSTQELRDHDLLGFLRDDRFGLGEARIAANDVAFFRAVVRAGGGIGVLPTFYVEEDVAHGDVVRVLPEWTIWTGTVWVVTPHGRMPPPRVTAFRALLGEALERSAVGSG